MKKAFCFLVLLLVSCSSGPTPEQIKAIQEREEKIKAQIASTININPDDFMAVWNKYYNIPKQTEFETKFDYEKRIPESPTNAFYFDITFQDKPSSDPMDRVPVCFYNADEKYFSIKIGLYQDTLTNFPKEITYLVLKDDSKLSTAIGQNAFGAKKEMFIKEGDYYGIYISNSDSFGEKNGLFEINQFAVKDSYLINQKKFFNNQYCVMVYIDPKIAKECKSNLCARFGIKLVNYPRIQEAVDYKKAEMDSPFKRFVKAHLSMVQLESITIYNSKTREIYKTFVSGE